MSGLLRGELCAYLGHGAVVDLDEVAGSRVHLEALVERQSGLDLLGSCADVLAAVPCTVGWG